MAILRRLLITLALALGVCSIAHAQTTTVIDGSQTNLVIVGQGNSTSAFVAWRAKFIPSHIIFAFELPAGFTAVNPIVECSLDDQALNNANPNDTSRWQQVAISALLSPIGGTAFDGAGPSVGTVGSAQVVLVETGVFPCVEWAIKPGSPNFNGTGNSKVTAVQLPASGDAAFLGTTGTIVTSGGPRVTSPGAVTPTSPLVTAPTTSPIVGASGADFVAGTQSVAAPKRADSGLASPVGTQTYFIGGAAAGGNGNSMRERGCNNSATITALGAATTQFPLTGQASGQTTRLCGAVMSNTNATATTVSIVFGTGATCTSPIVYLPPITLTANTGGAPNFGFGLDRPIWSTFGGNLNICAIGSAAGAVNTTIFYETD